MVPKPDREILGKVSGSTWPVCCRLRGARGTVDLVLWLVAFSATGCIDFICEADIVAVDFVGVDSYDGAW